VTFLNEEKLNPKLKADWVAALRSGEYRQARGSLKKPLAPIGTYSGEVGYCCLGVAVCVIRDKYPHLLKEAGVTILEGDNSMAVRGVNEISGSFGHLGCRLSRVIGLDQRKMRSLITKNDDEKLSLSEIAQYIEENL
jgi:hypothetical protein